MSYGRVKMGRHVTVHTLQQYVRKYGSMKRHRVLGVCEHVWALVTSATGTGGRDGDKVEYR